MTKALDTTMSACLEALDHGKSVDSILSRYPAMAAELRPFLETAVSLKSQPYNPTIAAKSASLAAMKREAVRLRPQKLSGFALLFHRARRFSPAIAVFALLIVLFMATIAPPSSPLYGARRFMDGLRGNLQDNEGVIDVPVVQTAVSPTISATMTISGTAVLQATATPSSTTTPSPTAASSITPSTTPTATLTTTPSPSPTQIAPTETAVFPTNTPSPTSTSDDDDESDDDEVDDD